MALIECKNCKMQISDIASKCPYCGSSQESVGGYENTVDVSSELQKKRRIAREQIRREKAAKQAEARKLQNARLKKMLPIAIVIVLIITASYLLIVNSKYNNAVTMMDTGRYAEAIATFEALKEYKDSENLILECRYREAVALIDAGKNEEAYTQLNSLQGYRDSDELLSHFEMVCDSQITQIETDSGFVYSEWRGTFDEKGNELTSVSMAPDGTVFSTENIYNEQGLLLTSVQAVQSNHSGTVVAYEWTWEYSYDEQGVLLSMVEMLDGEYQHSTEYSYDELGNLHLEALTNSSGGVFTYKYCYDDQGNLLSKAESNRDGGYDIIGKYTYDEQGNMLSYVDMRYGSNTTYTYSYDKYGNLLREDCYGESGIYYTYTCENSYDDYGNLLSRVVTDSDGYVSTTEYTYIIVYKP